MVRIGIDQVDKIADFVKIYRIDYPVPGALPYTVALDRKGSVVWRHLGAVKEPELRKLLDSFRR